MSKSNQSSGGIGFVGLLAIVFIVLKLCGVINWAWWIVLLPLEIPLAIFALSALIMIFCVFFQKRRNQRKYNNYFKYHKDK